MYLKLKQRTYERLMTEANDADMALASYINKLLENKTIHQGEITHGRVYTERTAKRKRMD